MGFLSPKNHVSDHFEMQIMSVTPKPGDKKFVVTSQI